MPFRVRWILLFLPLFAYALTPALIHEKYKAYFKTQKAITMCIDPDWMPLEAMENGKMVGVNREFIDWVQTHLPIPITLIPTQNWSESLVFAKQRKCDILSLVMRTPLREKYLNFTSSYLELPNVIIVHQDAYKPLSLLDLHGKKIGVVKNYAMAEIMRNHYPQIHLIEVPNEYEGLVQVQKGHIDGLVATSLAVAHNLQSGEFKNLHTAITLPWLLRLGFGVRLDDTVLLAILEEIVTQTPQTKLDAIFGKWITAKPLERDTNSQLFRNVMLALLAILLFILYHYHNSRKLNQKLQESLAIQIHDIRQKDTIIFHQNKLASMGEMIQNIAHQWRQPLAQINSAIGVIDNRLYQNSICDRIIEEKLVEIEKMTHYMSQTIDDFHGFLDENKQKESFNLYETIQKAIDITKGSLESCQIDIRLHLDINITLVGYPNELLHIFVVLLSNAKDSIQIRHITHPTITVLLKRIDNFFEIYFCDNAGGIDPSIEEKIFEPYFSTKGKQQGRGLGLYISKMIMQESFKGDIRLQNSLKGACFVIEFYQD